MIKSNLTHLQTNYERGRLYKLYVMIQFTLLAEPFCCLLDFGKLKKDSEWIE